jgi:hypothetical protein
VSPESVAVRARGAAGSPSGPRGPAALTGPGCRVLLLAGRREALWLARSPLVLAGLAVAAWLIWLNNRVRVVAYASTQLTFWWSADVSIVACLLAAAGGVLMAAQLAAGRARRDQMEQLYASYPASAAVRTGAQLVSVTGPVVLAAAVTGAAWAWLDSNGTLGAPRLWVLAAGLLLVAAAGTIGVALGTWLRHPMAGILVVLALGLIEINLTLSFTNPVHLPGGTAWLFPWSDPGSVLATLPGVTIPYPPPAHLAELAALIVLAVAAALWRALPHRRALGAVAVAALGVTCWSGWSQAKPVPGLVLAALVRQATQPAQVETCQRLQAVRYCYYPAFAPLVRQWAIPVQGVLTRMPRSASASLTVRQVDEDFSLSPPLLSPTSLTSIMSMPSALSAKLGKFDQGLSTNPGMLAGSRGSPVYTDLTSAAAIPPGASGGQLGAAQLALALSTAEWATGLPTTGRWVSYGNTTVGGGTALLSCVPVGQAREAIALWLAAGATTASRAAFTVARPGGRGATEIGRKWIATDRLTGSGPSVGLNATAQGAALAAEMLRLPQQRVDAVLTTRWRYWLRPGTTEAQLAAALGLRLPPAPAARPQPVGWSTVPNGALIDQVYNPPSPVCR